MWVNLNNFNIGTWSESDCKNQEHFKMFSIWKSEMLELWKSSYNPDFAPVRWNTDFVIVEYKVDDKKITKSLKQYNDTYDSIPSDSRPKINKRRIVPVIENTICILNHYNIVLKLNIIKRSIEINKDFGLEKYMTILIDNCTKHGYPINTKKLEADCIYIANQNKYNPIEDYLKYAYKVYLNNPSSEMFEKLCNTVGTIEEDKNWYLHNSLLQMVYMICRPETLEDRPLESQFLPVFQGLQGSQKTSWFRSLLPKKFQYDYFQSILVLDVGNKDHIIELSSNWLVEIGEISSTFKKSDQDSLKAYITSTKDRIRLPYTKDAVDYKRRTSFVGTTNDYEFLRDMTGSRRFLAMGKTDTTWDDSIDVDIMWGYFYEKYLNKERYWHTKNEIEKVESNNSKYMAKTEQLMSLEEQLNLKPLEKDGKWYIISDIYNRVIDKSMFTSKQNLGKHLKKYNVMTRYNKARKTNEYFIEFYDLEDVKI